MQKNAPRPSLPRLALCSLLAGLLNGLLGTGGGIPLWFVAMRQKDPDRAFASAGSGVLLLSFVSVLLYAEKQDLLADVSAHLALMALLGGTVGALLLGRLPQRVLKWLFAIFLIASGIYLIGKEICRALFA